MDESSILVILGVICLTLSAFFSGSETAIFSLSKLRIQRLREEGGRVSGHILRFIDNPRQMLVTVLIGNNFVNTAFATIATSLALVWLPPRFGLNEPTSATLGATVGTILLIIFGEVTPKTFGLYHSESFSRLVATPLWWLARCLTPFQIVLRYIVDSVAALFGIRDAGRREFVTTEELRAAITTGEATGNIDKSERQLIDRVFALRELMAKDIMVPRTEMICADIGKTFGETFALARSVGHSRLPVYDGALDNILGILHVKDFPKWRYFPILDMPVKAFLEKRSAGSLSDTETLLRPPLLVPETRRLHFLLQDFNREGTQMAILLDEYGGTAGLITLEDIVEEIVGEIVDEYDELLDETEALADFTPEVLSVEGAQLPAKLSLRHASRLLRVELDDEDADTVGGYVFGLFGRVPAVGETMEDANGLTFEVTAMTGTRIQKVWVRLPRKADNEEAEA